MLAGLTLRDFALIPSLELEFRAGMTVITGETGAGKSILIDAIGLALGDKTDASSIRAGAERAELIAQIDLSDAPAALAFLRGNELDEGDECWIRRVIVRDGRSKTFINQRPVALTVLAQLGELLVDIHGQHAHQSLARRDAQRDLLDDCADHAGLLDAVRERHQTWRQLRDEVERVRGEESGRDQRLELLAHQTQELRALALEADEPARLDAEHARLAHAGRLMEGCGAALQVLYDADEGTAHAGLARAAQEIESLAELDAALAPTLELLAGALIQAREAADSLRHYLDRMEIDPQRLSWVEQRIADIHRIARKHRVSASELPGLLQRLEAEQTDLENATSRRERLAREFAQAEARYREAAAALSESRREAGKRLARDVTRTMQELGMAGGRFAIEVGTAAEAHPAAHGLDQVEFLVSAGKGQDLLPVGRFASGGELSRISLAIQVVAAHGGRIPTLVFDEVDAGIGGRVAEIVGRNLRTLGERRQVLCVTHLPQVAAQGHQHLLATKAARGAQASTEVRLLGDEERAAEIARMLGGVEITERTREHALEMLARAQA